MSKINLGVFNIAAYNDQNELIYTRCLRTRQTVNDVFIENWLNMWAKDWHRADYSAYGLSHQITKNEVCEGRR